jgi:probable RNA-binding protein EIF1AD
MSGAGRKSLYRKSVTTEYLSGFPEPEVGDYIALVKASRGTNIFEVITGIRN